MNRSSILLVFTFSALLISGFTQAAQHHAVKSAKHASHPLSQHSKPAPSPAASKPFLIAIDAGHGGKDTGAIGYSGVYEKDVVYAISRKLEQLVSKQAGMRAFLVRHGDEFIPLGERSEIARRAGADLFISIHADAHQDDDARGSSVFTLATRKVKSGRIDGDTLQASNQAASTILGEMRKHHNIHCHHVKKARFAVLKSPDIPSMLIETGFMSNPLEEKNLNNQGYQNKLAHWIFNGIRGYVKSNTTSPSYAHRGKTRLLNRQPGTYLASK